METQHWLTGLHEHTLDGYGIPVGSAEGESALVLSAYVPQHKGEVDGGAEVPLLYFFTYSVDDIQSPEDYAFIHGQIITFEQLEQYKVYEDDQYVCYEVTDLFYTNLRQHVESIISQRSDIYFDEQVGNEWKIFIPTIRTEMFLLAVSTTMYLLNNDGMDQLPYLQEQNTDKNPH